MRGRVAVQQTEDAVRLCSTDPDLAFAPPGGTKRRHLDKLLRRLEATRVSVLADEDLLEELEATEQLMDELRLSASEGDILRVRELLRHGCSPNEVDGFGLSAVHLACRNGHGGVLRLCAESGGDLEQRGLHGIEPPLLLAVRHSKLSILRFLLSQGVDPASLSDSTGCTALHLAAGLGDITAVHELLKHGAVANTTDLKGNTPLHHAVQGLQVAVARTLIEHGASPVPKNIYGERPRDLILAGTQSQLESPHASNLVVGRVQDLRLLASRCTPATATAPLANDRDQNASEKVVALHGLLAAASKAQTQSGTGEEGEHQVPVSAVALPGMGGELHGSGE